MIMDGDELLDIREHRDASDEEKKITFCNSGIMAFRSSHMLEILQAIDNNNSQGEYYLPDAIGIARKKGLKVIAAEVPEVETLGVNDREQLAGIEELWQKRRRSQLLHEGVSMASPHTVMLSHDTIIEEDVVIEPNVVFAGGVTVRKGATIRAFSHLEGTIVGDDSVVGPYARLRPGTRLGQTTKVGNFVETKNADVQDGAKINHLSYVGDASVGAAANIGAGTITCNYDGVNKHHTEIGKGAFIGTNSSLVAPVSIGDGAMTAAGSVISKDVEADALAIERSPQVNKPGLAAKLWRRNRAIKDVAKK